MDWTHTFNISMMEVTLVNIKTGMKQTRFHLWAFLKIFITLKKNRKRAIHNSTERDKKHLISGGFHTSGES